MSAVGTLFARVTREQLALVLLLITWLVFLGLLWLILAVEPIVIPFWFFIPGFMLTLLFGAGLIAAKRWPFVWQRTFGPTLPLPPWVWIAGLTTVLAVVLATIVHPLLLESVLWIGMFSIAGCYAVLILTHRRWIGRRGYWPSWIAIAILGVLVFVGGMSIFIETPAFLTLVFFAALMLFAFHVWFILPLTLHQAFGADIQTPLSNPPSAVVLIPAYNEEGIVGDAIEAILEASYPRDQLEVVVIDDGSTDGTYAEACAYRNRGVQVYRRAHGGKHAALNFGLQCTDSEVVVTVDADSRPAADAIGKMVAQLQANSDIGALSAVVLAENTDTFIARLQQLEYIVSNTNRRAYSVFDAVPVVPGCLGVYRRSALDRVWQFDPDTVTEDFDVTVKLLKDGWLVRHGTGQVRTLVPDDWGALWAQRLRWYQGGMETLRKHKDALVSPRYEYLHALSLPARSVSHLLGPVMSFIIIFAVLWWLMTSPTAYLLALVGLFLVLTMSITLYSLILEGEPVSELRYSPLMFVGYKHLIDLTIGLGTLFAFLKREKLSLSRVDSAWRTMVRFSRTPRR